jgi:hypothetical protein
MHAVLITFQSAAGLDDLRQPFLEGAEAIRAVPGLISKTWLQNGATLGGFYLFTDVDAAQAYLAGQIITETESVPAFSEFQVEQFTVLEEFSAITRGVPNLAVR